MFIRYCLFVFKYFKIAVVPSLAMFYDFAILNEQTDFEHA